MRTRALCLAPALLVAASLTEAARAQQGPADTLSLVISTFLADSLERSVLLFTAAARQQPGDAGRHAWLAEAARRTRRWDLAAREARRALQLDSCSSFGHEVLSELFNPQYEGPDTTDADSSWAHALAATRCDHRAGGAWMALWIGALQRGDSSLERQSLSALVETEFLTRPYQMLARWMLESAPRDAILVSNGDLDTYPAVAMQLVARVRRDVVVVNTPLLNLPWYGELLRTRYGVPLPPEGPPDTVTRGEAILRLWRSLAVQGTLGRPFAFLMTSRRPEAGRLAGPYWMVDSAATLSFVDHDRVAAALEQAVRLDWAGPAVSPLDRSPIRNSLSWHPVAWVTYLAMLDCNGRIEANDVRGARERLRWTERFLARARVASPDAEEMLKPYREWLAAHPD